LHCNTLTHSARYQYNFGASQGQEAGKVNAGSRALSRSIRIVLWWQFLATAGLTLLAGVLGGAHGALSAGLGGAVSVCAGWVSGLVAATGREKSAGGVLATALKAEGVKLGVIASLLGIVLAVYAEVVVPAFLGSFIVTALIFSMAFFVREHNQQNT
jgi:ATP synthase protein I